MHTCEASVVVLTHNRRSLLERCLASVLAQADIDLEVWVVDSGSTDDTAAFVEDQFPTVRIIRREKNHPVGARNAGLIAATHEIVVSLDDDIELLEKHALRRVVERISAANEIGALTLKICQPGPPYPAVPEHWWHPRRRESFQDREFRTNHLNEAAVAFRSAAIAKAGYYFEAFYWGGEEWDLALGILDAGYDVLYFPEPALHLAPRGDLNRRADPRHALLVRNRCWTAFRRLPLPSALRYAIPRLAIWGWRAARHGYLRDYLAGLAGLVRARREIAASRAPISPETIARIRSLVRTPAQPATRETPVLERLTDGAAGGAKARGE